MPGFVRVSDGVVAGEITIAATVDRVFSALTDPQQVVRWWGSPEIYRVRRFELEPRVGGQWKLCAEGWAKETFHVSGTVLVYDPPHSLAFSWNPSWQKLGPTIVRFEVVPDTRGSKVRLVHEGFSRDRPGLEEHRHGWPLVLDWLQGFLDREGAERLQEN